MTTTSEISLTPIPFEAVGRPCRRASERERDNAAIELAAYVIGILKFGDDTTPVSYHRDELLKRANKVRVSHGNGAIVFVSETAATIRAVVEPGPKAAYDGLEAELRALLSTEEQMP
jgi:hypothetical protein